MKTLIGYQGTTKIPQRDSTLFSHVSNCYHCLIAGTLGLYNISYIPPYHKLTRFLETPTDPILWHNVPSQEFYTTAYYCLLDLYSISYIPYCSQRPLQIPNQQDSLKLLQILPSCSTFSPKSFTQLLYNCLLVLSHIDFKDPSRSCTNKIP